MEIPRDVLLVGIRAALAREYPPGSFREDIDHEAMINKLAQRQLDSGDGLIVLAIGAAIEAWENRPHPWGEAPDTDAMRQAALCPATPGTACTWPENCERRGNCWRLGLANDRDQ